MSEKSKQVLVARVEREIDSLLSAQGFSRRGRRTWLRKWGWKSDYVDVLLKEDGILINLYVWVPPEPSGTVDAAEVAVLGCGWNLAKIPGSIFRFPFFRFSHGGYIRRIRQVLSEAVNWFSRLDNPADCWRYMEQNEWKINSPNAQYCQKYLKSLPPEAQQSGARVKLERTYPSEYSRALFDLDDHSPLPEMSEDNDDDE
jgi:hypothetical protein